MECLSWFKFAKTYLPTLKKMTGRHEVKIKDLGR
jgi:hypothetical protein